MATWTVIDRTELSGAAASYNVTSIPTSYDHLYLMAQSRTDHATYNTEHWLTFNGDSGSNYNSRALYFGGPSAGSNKNVSATKIENLSLAGASVSANFFSVMEMWIFGYKSTIGHKSVLARCAIINDSATNWHWANNSVCANWIGSDGSTPEAIDEITLVPKSGDDYIAKSTFTLYGVTNDA